ncbi:hypothetical protein M413DRAFT_24248 [Hebeloma cylindrosporum]|uniref:Uncharacterized protein n=1 Tax=Hebeloma cylindrosporum TaxID=76867 RepID=A0A0C3CCN1_HEBCY|nr:hypothetical protein M413DRAFT_24248 [Hebeloma cylindrosporum h7]
MGILTPLYNLPNNVLEKQRMYQNTHKPIMLRGPRSNLYVGAYTALFITGMLGTAFAATSLVRGKKTE